MMRIYLLNILRRIPRRILFGIILFGIIFVVYKLLGSSLDDDEEWYKHPEAYFDEVECDHDAFTAKQYTELTEKLSGAFKKLGLTYFLCYGSLWGALRMKKTLPWDRNLDFCVLQHELSTVDVATLYNTLKSFDLQYYYNSRRGKYIVYYKAVSAEVTVFEHVGTHVVRVGWEKRILPHLYLNYQTFPYRLVEKQPLQTVEFNGLQVPVPNDGFEIQKYLYPDNWWRIVKPKGCLD